MEPWETVAEQLMKRWSESVTDAQLRYLADPTSTNRNVYAQALRAYADFLTEDDSEKPEESKPV